MRTGHKQGEMQLIAFTCRPRLGKADQLHLLSCVQRSRNAGFSCYNVTPLPCSTLFATVYKRPLKEEEGLLFGFLFFGLLALGKKILLWLVWEAFGREKNC
jgi:hypothetical protein